MDQLTTLSDQPNSGNNGGNDMVTALTSTVDGDEAPSMVDDGVALHGSLLNAPLRRHHITSHNDHYTGVMQQIY